MNLYEMTAQEREVLAQIEAAGGEKSEEQDAMLSKLDGDISIKVESICKIVKSMEADGVALDAECKRMGDRRKAIANKIAWLKRYIQFAMESLGKTQIKGKLLTASLRKCPASCVIHYPDAVPSKYKSNRTEMIIDKAQIVKDSKAGVVVPGVEMVTDKRTVQIG